MSFERFTVKPARWSSRLRRRRGCSSTTTSTSICSWGCSTRRTAGGLRHRLVRQGDGAGRYRRGGQALHAGAEGPIPFAPSAKKTLDLALREAQQLHHTSIGTEHILLALVTGTVRASARRCSPSGSIRWKKTRAAVLASLEGSQGTEAGPWPAGTPATEDTVAASALAGVHRSAAITCSRRCCGRRRTAWRPGCCANSGSTRHAVAAKIDELDLETTTDANPEEAAARTMEIRLVDDEAHLICAGPDDGRDRQEGHRTVQRPDPGRRAGGRRVRPALAVDPSAAAADPACAGTGIRRGGRIRREPRGQGRAHGPRAPAPPVNRLSSGPEPVGGTGEDGVW